MGHDLAAKLPDLFPHGDRRSPTGGTAPNIPSLALSKFACRVVSRSSDLGANPHAPAASGRVLEPPLPSPSGPPAGHGEGGTVAGVLVVAAFDVTLGGLVAGRTLLG